MEKAVYNERFAFSNPYHAANRTTKYRNKKRKNCTFKIKIITASYNIADECDDDGGSSLFLVALIIPR